MTSALTALGPRDGKTLHVELEKTDSAFLLVLRKQEHLARVVDGSTECRLTYFALAEQTNPIPSQLELVIDISVYDQLWFT